MKLDWRQVFLGLAAGLVLAAASHRLVWRRHHAPDKRFHRFSAELRLTEEQRGKVKALFEESRKKLDADVKALLTPEQQAKFEELRERRKRRLRR